MSKQWDIKIVADTNDADYVTQISSISDNKLQEFKSLIGAIKNFKPYTTNRASGLAWMHSHNFPNSEYAPRTDLGELSVSELYSEFKEELIEEFKNYVPTGEYGIHSIVSIDVAPSVKWTKLL